MFNKMTIGIVLIGMSLFPSHNAQLTGCTKNLRCPGNYFCDEKTDTCLPYSCAVSDACGLNERCVDVERACEEGSVCAQFVCEKTACLSTCGRTVPFGVRFLDDGSNYCNECVCGSDGIPLCSLIACDEQEAPECGTFEEAACKTACGNPVSDGLTFYDEGNNYCNLCTCDNSDLGCTRIGCDQAEAPSCRNDNEKTCLSTCGITHLSGETFQDDGDNYCNTCTCDENGFSSCTEIACDPAGARSCDATEFKTDAQCISTCGVSHRAGETFQDDGENYCNTCTCDENGFTSCTEIACDPANARSCDSSELECVSTCGVTHRAGETFQDDGENYCNTCTCDENGFTRCTEIACDETLVRGCEDDEVQGCETSCGEVVDLFSLYYDDGENACNFCFCLSNGFPICSTFSCDLDEEDATCN